MPSQSLPSYLGFSYFGPGVSSRLLQQRAAAASELGCGVALGCASASNQNREITPVVKTSAFDQYKRALCWSYSALSQISKLVNSSEISFMRQILLSPEVRERNPHRIPLNHKNT